MPDARPSEDRLREALEQALDRFNTIGNRLKPDATDEDREAVAQAWWFGAEGVRAALAASRPAPDTRTEATCSECGVDHPDFVSRHKTGCSKAWDYPPAIPMPAPDTRTEALDDLGYELWDSETANIIGAYPTLNELVEAAYGLGQANPDEEPYLSALDSRQIAANPSRRAALSPSKGSDPA